VSGTPQGPDAFRRKRLYHPCTATVSSVNQRRGDPSRVCGRRGDQHIEVLGRAWPPVRRECVGADQQEPDPMALQR